MEGARRMMVAGRHNQGRVRSPGHPATIKSGFQNREGTSERSPRAFWGRFDRFGRNYSRGPPGANGGIDACEYRDSRARFDAFSGRRFRPLRQPGERTTRKGGLDHDTQDNLGHRTLGIVFRPTRISGDHPRSERLPQHPICRFRRL